METYAVTAEFYDVLHAGTYQERARAVVRQWMDTPSLGVLEIGAGSGLVTEVLARSCPVPIHAVEPARAMRALLHTRLVTAGLTGRVTVHAAPVQDLGLSGVADLAVCLRTAATMAPSERARVWPAVAAALVRGGRLILDCPDEAPPRRPIVRSLGSHRVGDLEYAGEVRTERADGHRVRWRFTYQVRAGGRVQREATETFEGWTVERDVLFAELNRAGLRPVAQQAPDDLVVARLP